MIVDIKGTLAASKIKSPDRGQNFEPHQMLSVTQINDDELDVVKIKDSDLTRKHNEGQGIIATCNVNHWQMGNRGGMSVKLIDIKPAPPGSQVKAS